MIFHLRAQVLTIVALASGSPSDTKCSDTTTADDVLAGRDLSGQTHVLTGGDSGIGYYTALALASKNATVVLGLRGKTGKYANAVENITRITGNHKVFIVVIDLAKFSTVHAFVVEVRKQFPIIHTLICNAGMSTVPSSLPVITEDGFEMTFQVNFLSHALLVEELLPVLRQSHGRVIHVSSAASYFACKWAKLPLDCMELSEIPKAARMHGYVGNNSDGLPASSYGITKALMVFHAAELARREDQITAYSLHPGIVKSPMLDQLPENILNEWCRGDRTNCPLTGPEGAATSAFLATAPVEEEQLMKGNGEFYIHCKPSLTSVITTYKLFHPFSSKLEYQKGLYDMILGWVNNNTKQESLVV